MGYPRGAKLGSLAALLVVSLIVAACGSSSSSKSPNAVPNTSSAPTGQTSKPKFVAEADSVCRAAQIRTQALNAKAKSQAAVHDLNGLAATLGDAATIASQTVARLRALPRPADSTLAVQYFNGVAAEIPLIRQLATALKQNNSRAATGLTQQLNAGSAKVKVLARQYGFKVCASAR